MTGMSDQEIASTIQRQLNFMELDIDPANKKGSLITRMKKALVNFKNKLQETELNADQESEDSPNQGNLNIQPEAETIGGVEGEFLDLIQSVETGPGGYDAVNAGQRGQNLPHKIEGLSQMSLNEVISVTKARIGPNGNDPSSAAGKYQIINSTMRDIMNRMGLTGEEIFTPDLQDQMAINLLEHSGPEEW